MFENWGWEDTSRTLVIALVIAAASIAGVFIFAPKNVDYYYVSHSGTSDPAVCVYAHWTWHNDELAYCSDDKDKVLDFVGKADATLPKK